MRVYILIWSLYTCFNNVLCIENENVTSCPTTVEPTPCPTNSPTQAPTNSPTLAPTQASVKKNKLRVLFKNAELEYFEE